MLGSEQTSVALTMKRAAREPGAVGRALEEKLVYSFARGKAEGTPGRKDILGGKGAGLVEMSLLGVPVPPGFVISTRACKQFYRNGGVTPLKIDRLMRKYVRRVEKATGKKLGDAENPLLLSVRSGAPVSMPGMMDTILNVGLNDDTVEGLARRTGNPRFAWDCYRRLIQMFGTTVYGIPREALEGFPQETKGNAGTGDAGLSVDQLHRLVADLKERFRRHTGREFPQDVYEQLSQARDAVFRSWRNRRAIEYRRLYRIPEEIGTAVTVQAMVFGNLGPGSGTGVGFTRNTATGENVFYGEFLENAQGEDVVAGIRTPRPISTLREDMPRTYRQLFRITKKLEQFYRDVQDFEFTIEEKKLYLLQTRTAKRTGLASLRIAVDMVQEGILTPEEAVLRVRAEHLNAVLHPVFDPEGKKKFPPVAGGLNASPGAASGMAVFDPDEAVRLAEMEGKSVILVRKETSADDVHGMARSSGILTATGGFTSHAAVVARQMGKPSVVGCSALQVDEAKRMFRVGGVVVREGDPISIDGTTGEVMIGSVPLQESEIVRVLRGELAPESSPLYGYYRTFMEWVDKFRRLKVRANADTPADAERAFQFGAEGIGLCRTEHMFFAPDRLPIVREMILAETREERERALRKLLEMQTGDFIGLFEAMHGFPVTIRTLDPPLHEFLPTKEEIEREIAKLRSRKGKKAEELRAIARRAQELQEFNPMMGHRGCRLGISFPEITEMQAEAIFEAAMQVAQKNKKPPVIEIMVPLVSYTEEFRHQRERIDTVAAKVFLKYGRVLTYRVGTMIETPRAALIAGELARGCDFLSFGTNDLTQMTLAFSRDDARKFLPTYMEKKILEVDPFVRLDREGVGELMRMAVERARRMGGEVKIGICGEHGGEEESVKFCHSIGLNYVSCSPFRIPVARLAAAQAVLEESQGDKG